MGWQIVGDVGFPNVCDMCSASVANKFVHPQTASVYVYHSFGELAPFIDCILQMIRQGSSFPLVEQWEQYVLANHLNFLQVPMKSFCLGRGYWQLSIKVGVYF